MSDETKSKISWSGKTHTTETKTKISKSRIQYLEEHPDQVPYVLNHYSKGRSYPEQYWLDVLATANIQFEEQKRLGRFRIDFAIGHIALEIDGEQHYTDPRIVASNLRRDEELAKQGWRTIRVRWSAYKKLNAVEQGRFRDSLLATLEAHS